MTYMIGYQNNTMIVVQKSIIKQFVKKDRSATLLLTTANNFYKKYYNLKFDNAKEGLFVLKDYILFHTKEYNGEYLYFKCSNYRDLLKMLKLK